MNGAKLTALLVCAAVLAAPLGVHAEGEGTPKPAVAAPKKKKPKAAQPSTTPTAPIPYTTYKGLSPDMAKALTPSGTPAGPPATPDVAATPEMLPQPAETNLSPPPPPPPPPAELAKAPAPAAAAPAQPAAPDEISLRCDTTVRDGKRVVSSGSFYIDLFPSPVFPDSHADFKFLLADPSHPSLIRDSICLDTICSAEVSGQAYYLVNTRTRKGKALRITLDRLQGTFYAEKVDGGHHLGEDGTCTPQALPQVKF